MKNSRLCINWSKKTRYVLMFFLLVVIVFFLLGINLGAGSVPIALDDVVCILFKRQGELVAKDIIWQIRFPRVLAAMVLGGGLALSGYLLQTFFHNPIAGPFVLGISSGAKLVVAIVMILLLRKGLVINSFVLIMAAFIGSMLSMGFVLVISGRIRRTGMLIVGGVMIGYSCSSITDIIVTFASDSDIVNLHNWSKGSFSGMTWANVFTMMVVVLGTLIITFFFSKPIGAYQMGEAYAKNMGVNIKVFRVMLVILSSILSACVTAFAGPVSFVGIAVPQMIKRMFKTSKPILMIPGCFLGGSIFCMFCDLLARTVFAPTELSISTVTAVFGVPVVIFVMIHKKQQLS
jgi:iron complex transport system permease protein